MANETGNVSNRPRGLSRRQRAFVREKVLGLNDKEAALAAGYSPSVAENTKAKLWSKPEVKAEFERLKKRYETARSMREADESQATPSRMP